MLVDGNQHPPGESSRWLWIPLAVLALGVGSILLLVGDRWIRNRYMAPGLAIQRSVEKVQTLTAISHLWIEELVTGDAVDVGEIDRSLRKSNELVNEILGSSHLERLPAIVAPVDKLSLVELTMSIQLRLIEFTELSEFRKEGYRTGEEVGIGSVMDMEYDDVFRQLLTELRALEAGISVRLQHVERRSAILFQSTFIAWVVIVGLAVWALWDHERQRKHAEAALRESEEQLLQSQKMEAVGRLAGGISHDINNYLAAISAQCELVRMKSEPGSTVARKMDAVLETVARSSNLIHRLLAFSRREPVRPEVVDLNHSIRAMEGMIRRLLGEDIELELHLAQDLWPVAVDPSQMEQVVLNLAINSREAMPQGGTLVLATRNLEGAPAPRGRRGVDQQPERIELRVSDSGTGISPELKSKIFDPFFTTKDRASNSGLGLSTVHGIVTQNRGSIGVESNPGEGATFHLILPRSSEPLSDPKPVAPVSEQRTGKEHLLLVEDNPDVRRSTRDLLRAMGYEVTSARNGPEALDRFASLDGKVDLVITDVVMPGMSGKQLIESLRELEPELKVIYISGYAEEVLSKHGIDAQAAQLLAKPFTSDELATSLRGLLDT